MPGRARTTLCPEAGTPFSHLKGASLTILSVAGGRLSGEERQKSKLGRREAADSQLPERVFQISFAQQREGERGAPFVTARTVYNSEKEEIPCTAPLR